MSGVTWQNIAKSFGPNRAIDGVTLTMESGEIMSLLGPSGCGKTTLLRITAGLEVPDAGRVLLGGKDLSGLPPHKRGIGLMFQEYNLFPHLDVAGNISFGLKMKRWPGEKRRVRVHEMLRLVRLEGFEKRSVLAISGGEQQRVALARSLAPSPSLLMLDEPLGALDAELRSELLNEAPRILRKAKATVLYVTHDQEEALAVADRVALMREGKIVQVGSPLELVEAPVNAFIASFLKLGALIPAFLRGRMIETDIGVFPVDRGVQAKTTEGLLLVRPSAVRFSAGGNPSMSVKCRIVSRMPSPGGTALRVALLGKDGAEYELTVVQSDGQTEEGIRTAWLDIGRTQLLGR